ncbi:MAG TPA: heme ABC transporter ATP-binding protein, partial [Thermoanaerobaculia bacterium]
LDRAAIHGKAARILDELDVRPRDAQLPARVLSGGNQQKLVIGREVLLPPRLLLVAQPTRGVDIGAIELIHRRLLALRDAGCAIVLVSSELEEVTALADRLLVFREGRIAGEVDPRTATVEAIGLLMTGGERQAAAS